MAAERIKMKKRVLIALLLCLAMCVSMFMIGCEDPNPDNGGQNPDNGGQNPDNGGQNPDNGDQNPDNGGQNPDGGGDVDSEEVILKVTFVDSDGNVLAGVKVGICIDGVCLTPKRSDENGVAQLKHDSLTKNTTEVDLNITGVPEGFVKPTEYIKLTLDGSFEKTVVLDRITETVE